MFVKVQPGSGKNRIVGNLGGRLKLAVSAAPEKGKANKAIVELLAETLHINESSIHIISGKTSRDKKLMIEGVSPENINTLLKFNA
ncbi:MAG: DUF167 domain-containing protein [Candidatus Kuenenia sp.]|nr:DUF167 domain-containing protein [Candidatus Kuenenia hertensis]